MGSRRHRIATLVAAAILALPAGAWAQSAGDEQYEDPFAPEPGQSDGAGSPDDEPAGGESSGSSGGGSTSEAAPAPAAPAQTAQTQAQPSAQEQLPRTGADAGWLALSGTLLLAGGIVLRVRLSEPARRRR